VQLLFTGAARTLFGAGANDGNTLARQGPSLSALKNSARLDDSFYHSGVSKVAPGDQRQKTVQWNASFETP